MKIDKSCVMCGRHDEDGAHLFFKCKFVRHIWAELQLEGVRQEMVELLSAREVLELILKLKPDSQGRVITLLYLWWSERCSVREGGQRRSESQIACLIYSYAEEWSPFKQAKVNTDQPPARKTWKPPPEDVVKLNCDSAFFAGTRNGGCGFVIREWDGGVISAGYGKLENVNEAFHAKVIACLQGIQRAADLGVQKLILETDASMVAQAMKSTDYDRSSAGGLIWEMKDLLASNFASIVVNQIPRSCNSVADSLAALRASLGVGAGPVMDSIPICIRQQVVNDLATVYE
jgi:ribonuclease HI